MEDFIELSSNAPFQILQQVIIKNATIIDDGIQETYPSESLIDEGVIDNSAIIVKGIQEFFDQPSHQQLSAEVSQCATIVDEGIQETYNSTNILPTHAEIMKTATIIDEGIQETYPNPDSSLTPAEIIKNATIIDEGIKLCPLCRNEVRLFFINFNEKVLMCENFDCDYPFGHDEIIFLKENNNIQSSEEVASIRSKPTRGSPTATCSVISTNAWLDIDKINNINDSESNIDSRSETREYYRHKKDNSKRLKKMEVNPKVLKEVKAIEKMNMELKKVDDRCIKNEKWIKNLMNKQLTSGMALLKPEEINMFKQKRPELGLGELKIDINKGTQENMSLIKIELSNANVGNKTAGSSI